MVDRIYPAELQLYKVNSSDTEAPFLDLNYPYLMVHFPIKFMINWTISILIWLISPGSLMALSLGVPRKTISALLNRIEFIDFQVLRVAVGGLTTVRDNALMCFPTSKLDVKLSKYFIILIV